MRVTPKRVRSEAAAAAPSAAASAGSASAAAAAGDIPTPAKRSKRDINQPAAVDNALAAIDAPIAAAAASAGAAGSSASACSGSLAALLESNELLALLTGTKPPVQILAAVDAKLKEELQRIKRGEPRLLDFDLADTERPNSGGTLLTTLLSVWAEVRWDNSCEAGRKAGFLVDSSLSRALTDVLEDAVFNVHAVDEGWSVLQLACDLQLPWEDCWQCNLIRVLLRHGADINAPGPKGPVLLRWATMEDWRKKNSIFAVLWLLDQGADINAQDADGDALMHAYAAIQPTVANFKALVNSPHFAKANLLLRSGDGLTPLQVARAKLAELRADPDADGDFIERQNFIVRVLTQLTPSGAPVAASAMSAAAATGGNKAAPAAAASALPVAAAAPPGVDASVSRPMKTES